MAESIKLPKPKYGQIVVLQKNGDEPRGHGFPLVGVACTIGRSETCDIRVSSADVSMAHCRVTIEEATGEASLDILGIDTEINGSLVEPDSKVKLNHKDVIVVGGRRLRFEYLPPDYKPKPGKVQNGNPDNLKAEVVDTDFEVSDPTELEMEAKEPEPEPVPVPVPATPNTAKRVSFGPYLSPEQFDNNLPPATPIKRGATPRRSVRYSGLRFSRPPIESVIEEETSKVVVEETVLMDGTADSTTEKSVDDDVPDASSMASGDETSEVSNVSVLPSECCSYLDDSISVDLSSISHTEEVVVTTEMEFMEPPSVQDTPVASPSEKDVEDAATTEDDTQEMSTSKQSNGDAVVVEPIAKSPKKAIPQSPQADYTDEAGIKQSLKTSKLAPESPKADYSDVGGVKSLLQTPMPATQSPKADYSDVDGVKKLMQPETPKADYSDVTGLKKLMQTPKAAPASPSSPDVEGVKDLMKTPKPGAVVEAEDVKTKPQMATVVTLTGQNDETPKRGASTRRQSGKTPRGTTTSPKAEFAESQAPPAALMAGDDEEDENQVEGEKEQVGEPKVDEVPGPQQTEVGESQVVESVNSIEATPKRGSRKSVIASATKSTTRSRRSKATQEEQSEAEPQQTVEEPKETPDGASVEIEHVEKVEEPVSSNLNEETVPEEPKVDTKEEKEEQPQEPTTTKETEASDKAEEKVEAPTPRRGGRRAAVTPKVEAKVETPRSTRARRGQKAEPEPTVQGEAEATFELPSSSQETLMETVETKETGTTIVRPVDETESARKDEVVEETLAVDDATSSPVAATPKRGGRRAPVAPAIKLTTRPIGDEKDEDEQLVEREPEVPRTELNDSVNEETAETEDSSIEKSGEFIKKSADVQKEKTDEPADQVPAATPRRGGRNAPAASAIRSAIRSRGGQKMEPEETEVALIESKDPASHEAVGTDMAEKTSRVAADTVDVEEDPAPVSATPRRGGRKAAVASATKSATRSKDVHKVEGEEQKIAEPKDSGNDESPKAGDSTTEKSADVDKGKSEDPVEPALVVPATPKRGGRKAPAASATKSATRSRGALKADPVEHESSGAPQTESPSKQEPVEEASEKGEPQSTEEPAVSATPKRGGRKTAVASATKASATKAVPRSRRGKAEEPATEEVEEPQQPSEEPKEAAEVSQQDAGTQEESPLAAEAEEQSKSAARPKRGKATATAKDTHPLARVKRGKAASVDPEEPQQAEEEATGPAEEDASSEVFEAEPAATPKQGGRKAPAAKTTRSKRSKSTEEPAPEVEASIEAVEEKKAPITPKRGARQAAVAETADSPKAMRSTRAKRGSESDAAEADEAVKDGRPTRAKRGRKDSDSDHVTAESTKNPVVRLTRVQVPSPAEKAAVARKTRGKPARAEPEPIAEEELVEDVPVERVEAEKPAVRKGRGRGAKAADEPLEAKPSARRGRAGSTDSESRETEAKKALTRRGAAGTKRVAAAMEQSAESAVDEKKRRGAKKPLDDVELKHEGKGHAADIHANHVPDDAEDEAPATRTTRGKRAVHFDVRSPGVSSQATAATSPTVKLERDPELDKKAAATKDQEAAPRGTKRTRPKGTAQEVVQEDVQEDVQEEPAAKAKRAARGGKKPEPEAVEEQAAPSPRRTRRARN